MGVEGWALRVDHAEAVAGRGLHHDPALDAGDDLGAKRFEARDLGLLVVGFDIHMDAGGVIDRLHQHLQIALIGDLGIFAFCVDFDRAAQGGAPGFPCGKAVLRTARRGRTTP